MKHSQTLPITLTSICIAFFANKIVYTLRDRLQSGTNVLELPQHMFDDFRGWAWLHVSIHPIDIGIGLFAGLITGILLSSYFYTQLKLRTDKEHGSATWARSTEMRRWADPNARLNMLFAQGASLALNSLRTMRNLNALVIGGSGSGKSRFYVCPNLYQANTSYVVTDPKGELYRKAHRHLAGQGYTVRCLNFIDFAQSARYNPLAYINPEQAEVDIMILTENLITNTNGNKPAADSGFWEKAERALLNALTAYVYFSHDTGTLIDVADLLSHMQASEQDENQQSYVDYIFAELKNILDDAERSEHEQQFVTDLDAQKALTGLRFAYAQYRTYLQGAGETKKSIIISLAVRLAPLQMTHIRDLLSTDTIQLDAIGMEKTALFLIIPDTHAAFNFLAAIFYEQLFETNLYIADHRPDGRLPELIQCFMDEFANIGKIPSFERKIAVMRSRGISVSVIVQNMAQGKSIYKDDWDTIIGNCDSFLFLGGQEKSTTEYISKMLGKETIYSREYSQSRGRSGSSSMSERKMSRDLLTPDEIGRLHTNQCIYMLRGINPYLGSKLTYPNELDLHE